jgi:glycosyltransferase involved in cell wall biosynthesis
VKEHNLGSFPYQVSDDPLEYAPTISVVIPNKDRLDSLIRAVESVKEQNYKNLEIIIVDDSRIDLFNAILKQFRDTINIKVVRGDARGDAAARRKGVDAANGEIVAFLDSDDRWLPQKIDSHLAMWKRNVEVGFTWDLWEDGNGFHGKIPEILPDYNATYLKIPRNKIFSNLWLIGNFIHMSSGMAKKASIEAIGGFPVTSPCDWHLWLLLSSKYDGGLINKICTVKESGELTLGTNKKVLIREFRETVKFRFLMFKYLQLRGDFKLLLLFRRFIIMYTYWLYILVHPKSK